MQSASVLNITVNTCRHSPCWNLLKLWLKISITGENDVQIQQLTKNITSHRQRLHMNSPREFSDYIWALKSYKQLLQETSLPSRSAVCYTRNMHISFCAIIMLFFVDCIISVAVTCNRCALFSHFILDHVEVCTCWRKQKNFLVLHFICSFFTVQCKDEAKNPNWQSFFLTFQSIVTNSRQSKKCEMLLAEHICISMPEFGPKK